MIKKRLLHRLLASLVAAYLTSTWTLIYHHQPFFLTYDEQKAQLKQQQQQQQNGFLRHSNNGKPWLVIHIGPPKTATTSIQCGLERYARRLANDDNLYYLGGGCGTPGQEYTLPNGQTTILARKILHSLNQHDETSNGTIVGKYDDSFEQLMQRLRRNFYAKNRSVIISSELLGSQLNPNNALDWFRRGLTQEAHYPLENIRIVLAYRHFVDWIPSHYYQDHYGKTALERFNSTGTTPTFGQYVNTYLDKWEQQQQRQQPPSSGGIRITTPLEEDRYATHPSWWLYQVWSKHFPNNVQLYDMHHNHNHINTSRETNEDNDDIITHFVCQVLPFSIAAKTCHHLSQTRYNKGKDDNDDEHLRTKSLSEHSFLHPEHQHSYNKQNSSSSIVARTSSDSQHHATRLIQEAFAQYLVPTFTFDNDYEEKEKPFDMTMEYLSFKQLVNKTHFLLQELNIVPSTTSVDGDKRFFDCLSASLEERLWNASRILLDLVHQETTILAPVNNKEDEEVEEQQHRRLRLWRQSQMEHDRLFAKNKAAGKYCDINPHNILHHHPTFLRRLQTTSNFGLYRPSQLNRRWSELSLGAKRAVRVLGFDSTSWNGVKRIPVFGKTWTELEVEKQEAALKLGWDSLEWSRFIEWMDQRDNRRLKLPLGGALKRG